MTFDLFFLAVVMAADPGTCSKAEVYGRSDDVVYFVGRSTSDTVLAGLGSVEPSGWSGHFGTGARRRVYGQVVSVERPGSDWAHLFSEGEAVAVLVPWDYGPDCSPVHWGRSAAWMSPRDIGLFSGTLRSEEHWVDGIPTLDVFSPQFVPYRHNPSMDRHLLPQDLLTLIESLPSGADSTLMPEARLAGLDEWTRRHPRLAELSPAPRIIRAHRRGIAWNYVRNTLSPVAGTYDVVIERPSGARVTVRLATESRPWNTLSGRRRGAPPAVGLFGVYLAARVVESDGQLGWGTQLAVAVDSSVSAGGVEWIGDMPSIRLAVRYAPDEETEHAFVELYDETARVTGGDYFPGLWAAHFRWVNEF